MNTVKKFSYHTRRLLNYLSRHRKKLSPLLILTHDYPDPDTLASAFTLQYICQKAFGIESRIAYGGVIGRMENREMVSLLRIPAHKVKPSDFRKHYHVALVDTQPEFSNNSFPKDKKAAIVIDQHPSIAKPHTDFSLVDPECGATSVLMSQALLASRLEIPRNLATALAYGILSDTLDFYRAGSAEVIQTYLSILHHGDLRALAQIQNPSRSRRFFRTLASGIQHAVVKRRLILSHLGIVEHPDLVSQIADFLLSYKPVIWSLCSGRFKGKLYVSLRSEKTQVEAGDVLRDVFLNRGEAGGHDTIAGGSFKVGKSAGEDEWDKAESLLTERILKRLRISSKRDDYYPFR